MLAVMQGATSEAWGALPSLTWKVFLALPMRWVQVMVLSLSRQEMVLVYLAGVGRASSVRMLLGTSLARALPVTSKLVACLPGMVTPGACGLVLLLTIAIVCPHVPAVGWPGNWLWTVPALQRAGRCG